MLLVETEVAEFTRRSRSLLVSHTAVGLPRGLEPGEVVVVRSGGEHWTGCVVDVDFTLDDTVYRLSLGGVVPADQAEALLGEDTATAAPRVDVADVVAMLGSLRAVGREALRVPAQRRAAALLAES